MRNQEKKDSDVYSALRTPHSAFIRVLVVDDSAYMRAALTHLLKSKGIEVGGTAGDGEEAVRKVKSLRPDAVLLDIEMPVMDGLEALSRIMAECPTPVVMLSGLGERDARIAIKSLEHGAVDFIPKPSGSISYDIERIRDDIVSRVTAAAGVDVRKMAGVETQYFASLSVEMTGKMPVPPKDIVVIGASTGGPRAVARVLSGIRSDISAGIVIVQHMGKEFIPSFAERLMWGCPLDISVAGDGDVVQPGRVLIVPGDRDTSVDRDREGKGVVITREAHALYPSIDYTMESSAHTYGERALGVILTGVGSDGAKGMKAIKEAGGRTIAEDQSRCVVYGMPRAAIEMGVVDEVVPLPGIAEAIMRRV